MFQPHDRIENALSFHFDDVALLPDAQQCAADQVKITAHFSTAIKLHSPFISGPDITDIAMAIHMAQQGSIGIIPNNVSPGTQADMIRQIKRFQSRIVTDIVKVTPETSIIEALEYKQRYNNALLPVIEGGTQFLAGFVDLQGDMDSYDPEHTVSHYMSVQPYGQITQSDDMLQEASALMESEGFSYVAIMDTQNRFIGLICKSDQEKIAAFPQATIDQNGALRVAAMVGTGTKEYDRVHALMDAKVDAIVIYADHGHSKEALDIITHIRRQRSVNVDVVAGNIMTEQSAIAVIDAGANGILISPNAQYDRLGIGVPLFSSILNVAEAASLHQIPVSVGHMPQYPLTLSDKIKAFAAGANTIQTDNPDQIASDITALRQAISYTGCTNSQEFTMRSRFARILKK